MSTKVAIVQEGPVHWNLTQSIEKAVNIIKNAAKEEAELIVFGECWLTGYPAWIDYCRDVALWDHPPVKQAWAQLYENSVAIDSPEIAQIASCAKEHKMTIVLGMNEVVHSGKGNNSLYNTVIIISADGVIANHHRKLMPTYTERLIHAHGDGHGLNSINCSFGRLGALICWEHWMPLTRQAMHDEGEDIHIALWPNVKEMHIVASRQYAFEGRCHVISVGQCMPLDATPDGLEMLENMKEKEWAMNGGSCIVNPDGSMLLEPQYDRNEVIYVTLPPTSEYIGERMNLSVSGHYQRHDVFSLDIDKSRPS